jgi:hypothetical protein
MLVKELRQGLRSRAFTAAFLFLQGMLLLFMMSGFSEQNDGRDTAAPFWILLELALLVLMPMRGLGALHAEIRSNTLELISLTRMSAWKIVFGKWSALVSQSGLIAVAVMPYIVLRYFFGGMNVLVELGLLLAVLLFSGWLSAFMVAVSVLPNAFLRLVFAFPSAFLISWFLGGSVVLVTQGDGAFSFALRGVSGPWLLGLSVAGAVFLIYYFLDMAASRIAPQAVNYVTRRRLIGLAVFVLVLALIHGSGVAGGYLVWVFLLFGLLALDALTEHPATVASVYAPFRRHAWLRPGQVLFVPGWFSGIFFLLVLGAGIVLADGIAPEPWNSSSLDSPLGPVGAVLAALSAVFFPLGVTLLFWPRHAQPLIPYCVCAFGMTVLAGTINLMADGGRMEEMLWIGLPLPPVAAVMALERWDDGGMGPAGMVSMFVTVVVTTFLAVWRHRQLFASSGPESLAAATESP